MLFPSIFRENLYDDFFGAPFGFGRMPAAPAAHAMKTESSQSSEQKDDDGNYIRRERYTGSFSRSFYVGDEVTEADIKARFADGVLTLNVPKKEPVPKIPEKKIIAIE